MANDSAGSDAGPAAGAARADWGPPAARPKSPCFVEDASCRGGAPNGAVFQAKFFNLLAKLRRRPSLALCLLLLPCRMMMKRVDYVARSRRARHRFQRAHRADDPAAAGPGLGSVRESDPTPAPASGSARGASLGSTHASADVIVNDNELRAVGSGSGLGLAMATHSFATAAHLFAQAIHTSYFHK